MIAIATETLLDKNNCCRSNLYILSHSRHNAWLLRRQSK